MHHRGGQGQDGCGLSLLATRTGFSKVTGIKDVI
jgi:hypothetical protein